MPIQVTCPKCLTRFAVSEKFAGKKGPCPKCKAQIEVPKETDAVVIHAPADDAPKDSKGRSVLSPIKRKETRLSRRQIAIVSVSVLLAIGVAIGLGIADAASPLVVAIGALLIAPPLIWAGYSFSYDQEFDPYVGRELQIRVLILSVIFATLWLVYAYIPTYLLDLAKPSEMPIAMAAVMFAVVLTMATFAAIAAFELETVGGMTLAGVYFISTLLLAYLAGVPLFGAEPETRRRPTPPTPQEVSVQLARPNATIARTHFCPLSPVRNDLSGRTTSTCDASFFMGDRVGVRGPGSRSDTLRGFPRFVQRFSWRTRLFAAEIGGADAPSPPNCSRQTSLVKKPQSREHFGGEGAWQQEFSFFAIEAQA